MKNVVVGTAGHIDHGKTTLVKRLTGIDTDRLAEEKKRSMSIELGFASLELPSGNRVSIVDVPGHEKFIKTMVAGVTGIDVALLVVAADEGIMPQTIEHINILSVLGVNSGVVALTKADLAEDEKVSAVREEIRNALSGTELEHIDIISVSAVSGVGIDQLIDKIEELARETAAKSRQELFRLPVDRVFTIAGHGTVITGTVIGGSVSKGDTVELLPEGLTVKVRNVQVHNESTGQASAGDRCALNLSGIEKSDIGRGTVAVEPNMVKPVQLVDAVIHTVKGTEGIDHNQRVHVHIGTTEVLARVRILGSDHIGKEDFGYAQLRLEEPVVALRGDRFIIRDYSPVVTLGGGRILFHTTKNRKRFDSGPMEAMKIGNAGDDKKLVEFIISNSEQPVAAATVFKETLIDKDQIEIILSELIREKRIGILAEAGKYFSMSFYGSAVRKVEEELKRVYRKYPYRYQITKEEIKSRIFPEMASRDFSEFIDFMAGDKKFQIRDNDLSEAAGERIEEILQSGKVQKVEALLLEENAGTVSARRISEELKINELQAEEILRFLASVSRIVPLDEEQYIHRTVFNRAIKIIRQVLDEEGQITAAQFRDALQIGRKAAIVLLEYFDRIRLTQREENIRKPGVRYKDVFI